MAELYHCALFLRINYKKALSRREFRFSHNCNIFIFSKEAGLWLHVEIILGHRYPGVSALKIFVMILLFAFQYHPVFFPKEHSAVALTSR